MWASRRCGRMLRLPVPNWKASNGRPWLTSKATQEPPAKYAPVAAGQTLVVEADGVMARYRDRHLDGTLIKGEWHEIKLGLAGGWQDDQLVSPSYVAARETASAFAPRLGTEAARRGALDIVAWRGVGKPRQGCDLAGRSRCLAPPIGDLSRFQRGDGQDARNRTWLFPHQC